MKKSIIIILAVVAILVLFENFLRFHLPLIPQHYYKIFFLST